MIKMTVIVRTFFRERRVLLRISFPFAEKRALVWAPFTNREVAVFRKEIPSKDFIVH